MKNYMIYSWGNLENETKFAHQFIAKTTHMLTQQYYESKYTSSCMVTTSSCPIVMTSLFPQA